MAMNVTASPINIGDLLDFNLPAIGLPAKKDARAMARDLKPLLGNLDNFMNMPDISDLTGALAFDMADLKDISRNVPSPLFSLDNRAVFATSGLFDLDFADNRLSKKMKRAMSIAQSPLRAFDAGDVGRLVKQALKVSGYGKQVKGLLGL